MAIDATQNTSQLTSTQGLNIAGTASEIKHLPHSMRNVTPSWPPRDTSSKNAQAARLELQMDAHAKDYEASGAYAALHKHYAEKFPGLGPADGTPIGQLLSDMVGGEVKDGLKTGDILVAYEPNRATIRPNRLVTVSKQDADHNGMRARVNQGDARNVHNAVYVPTPGNPAATEPWGAGEPDVVEARAARDWPVPINRVQPAARSAQELRHFKVYRPTTPNLGNVMAQVAMSMANGHIVYATKALSDGATTTNSFELSADAKKTAAAIAKDGFEPVINHFVNASNTADRFKKGVNCTSFVAIVGQQAQLQIARAEQQERKLKGEPDAKVSTFAELAETHLKGTFAINPNYVSVRTFEHFLLNGKDDNGMLQFECVGKMETTPKDTKYPEKVPPMTPAMSSPLPPTHPHSIEFEQKQKEAKKEAAWNATAEAAWQAAAGEGDKDPKAKL